MHRFALCALFLISVAQLHAEQLFKPIQQNAGVAANGLQASLSFVKSDFGPGESIVAAWKITNVSEKPVSFSVNRNTWYDVAVNVRRNGKALELMRQVDRKDMKYASTTFTLEPAAFQTFTVDVRSIDWTEPAWCHRYGMYDVQLTLGGVQTPWTRFRITVPGEHRPELSPEQAERFHTLLEELTGADFAARERAFSEIKALGKAALTPLEETIGRNENPELVARCKQLIQEINPTPVITRPVPPPPPILRPVHPPIVRPQPQPPLPPPDLEF